MLLWHNISFSRTGRISMQIGSNLLILGRYVTHSALRWEHRHRTRCGRDQARSVWPRVAQECGSQQTAPALLDATCLHPQSARPRGSYPTIIYQQTGSEAAHMVSYPYHPGSALNNRVPHDLLHRFNPSMAHRQGFYVRLQREQACEQRRLAVSNLRNV